MGSHTEVDNRNVRVRNTFLHLSNRHQDEEENDVHSKMRSSSAPPSCRKPEDDTKYCDIASVSTRCKTVSTEVSSSWDIDEQSSHLPEGECKDESPRASSHVAHDESDHGEAETSMGNPSDLAATIGDAEHQIEEMSQRVMEIWSRLRSVEEASPSSSPSGTSPYSSGSNSCATWMPVQYTPVCYALVPTPAPIVRTPLKTSSVATSQKLDSKAPLFTPSCKAFGDAQDVVASVRQLLTLALGVANVEVQWPTSEGTLTTIAITLDQQVSTIESVITTAKRVILEAASNSQSVYVMGYEAEPFKIVDDSTFVLMLASLPATWHRSACWDTYQYGSCPRGKSCKWQHPGKHELQPVRVLVS